MICGQESFVGVNPRPGRGGCGDGPGLDEIGEVGEGMSDCGHFPVEDADYAGFGGMEDEIVDFEVAVEEDAAIFGLGGGLGEVGEEILKVRELADGDPRVDVLCGSLGLREGGEGFDLSGVET